LNGTWLPRSLPRTDGGAKADGSMKFFSDLFPEGCLHGKVIRSPHPRARIMSLDVVRALKVRGVECVLTAKDVPGMNAYGVFYQEAPVLCHEFVNFVGDPVALVAAETEEQAEAGAEAVEVRYEPLPAVTSMEEALKPGAPSIHPKGNVARHALLERGDTGSALARAHLVVKNTYLTQRQKHMFLEPEAGVGYYDQEGKLTLLVGGQSPYRDRLQVARSLGIPKEEIRVVSFPVGGAFGGKDDVTVQIHLALLVMKTKKPVKMVWTREESGAAGYSRHPFKIEMETGVNEDGKLVANRALLFADTGPYQSFGPAVLDVAMETINGPYFVPNYVVDAHLVRTNNGISAAFRGFGAPQANFAIEGQMNEISEKMGMDRLELRRLNIWRSGEEGNFGLRLGDCSGLSECVERASKSPLLSMRGHVVKGKPWVRRGLGVSLAVKGIGFGTLPDYPEASVEVDPGGFVKVGFSNPDYGQGLLTANLQVVAEKLGLSPEKIVVEDADSGVVPDTGSSSASRSTYTAGGALLDACDRALFALRKAAASELKANPAMLEYRSGRFYVKGRGGASIGLFDVARVMSRDGGRCRFVGSFPVPRHPSTVAGSLEIPHFIYSFAALLGEVEVDVLLGKVEVKRLMLYADVGRVLNPTLASAQCDGGMIQGVGYALMEDHIYEGGHPKTKNFSTYLVPCPTDVPTETHTEFVSSSEGTGPYGAKGVGEIPIVPVASCISDAIHDAVGVRLRELPMKPERVLEALGEPQLNLGPLDVLGDVDV